MKKISNLFLFTPILVFAADTTLFTYLEWFGNLLGQIVPFLITLGVVAFFWGLVQFINGGADIKEKGKSLMLGSIIALALMVGVWGVVRITLDTFDVNETESFSAPTIPTPKFDSIKN